jgi:hypothetical protein
LQGAWWARCKLRARRKARTQAGDALLAFWDGRSAGTRHIIGCMQQLGKPVVVIRVEATA